MISNSAAEGGGLFIVTTTGYVFNSTFVGNRAERGGGACWSGADGGLLRSEMRENTASDSGGGLWVQNGPVFAEGTRFVGNAATNNGGAVGVYLGASLRLYVGATPFYLATNGWPSLVQGNRAGSCGGGIYAELCTTVVVTHTAILSNRAHLGAGVYEDATQDLQMENCAVAGTLDDAAVLIEYSTGRVACCTFTGNPDGDLFVYRAALTMSNSIAWDGLYSIYSNTAVVNVSYCDVQYGYPGPGNIDTNPLLFGNCHLRPGSPCINAGTPVWGIHADVDGETRVGNHDMGCDEFVDDDGDGLPSVFESGTGVWVSDSDTGSSPYNPDSDFDGSPDWEEWLADTDPNAAGSRLDFARLWLAGDTSPRVRWTGGVRADRWVEWCSSLATGTWNTAMHETPPTAKTNEWVMPSSRGVFVRLRVER